MQPGLNCWSSGFRRDSLAGSWGSEEVKTGRELAESRRGRPAIPGKINTAGRPFLVVLQASWSGGLLGSF